MKLSKFLQIFTILYVAILDLGHSSFNRIEKNDPVDVELKGNFHPIPKEQIIILHSAFEGPNAKVGGLGAVVTDLITYQNLHRSQNKKTMESYALTPYYQFLKDKFGNNVTQVGQFSHHMFERMVTTTVYKNNVLNQFFLEPEESIRNCTAVVKKADDIYEQSYIPHSAPD